MNIRKRYVYMDVLRITACLCVIYNHVNEYGFFMFAGREIGSAQYYIELFASMLCKMAVPIFLMLSGALMLSGEVSIKRLWTVRIPRIAFSLLFFSGLFYVRTVIRGQAPLSIKTFIFGLYESEWNYAYWYLYMYLAFLIALPVLSRFVQAMDNRTFIYFLSVAVFFRCILPGFEAYHWEDVHKLNPNLNVSFLTCDAVLFPSMGYYLHHRLERDKLKKVLPGICAAAVLLTAVSCVMTCRVYYRNWVAHTQTYHNLFVPFVSATVFSCAKVLFEQMSGDSPAGHVLVEAGQCTFGVYLIHLLATEGLTGLGGLFDWMNGTGILPVLGSFLYCFAMMLICMVPVYLLRKIPGISKLL